MGRVSLKDVVRKAAMDQAFFQSLVEQREQPERALSASGMELSEEDAEYLKKAMTGTQLVEFDLSAFLEQFHGPDGSLWSEAWPAEWSGPWVFHATPLREQE